MKRPSIGRDSGRARARPRRERRRRAARCCPRMTASSRVLGQKPSDVKPDNVTVIDLNSYPPRVIGKVERADQHDRPADHRRGRPRCELRDRHQRPEVRSGGQYEVHPRRHRLGHRPEGPDQPEGHPDDPGRRRRRRACAINRAGTLALVAATGEGTISVYSDRRTRR